MHMHTVAKSDDYSLVSVLAAERSNQQNTERTSPPNSPCVASSEASWTSDGSWLTDPAGEVAVVDELPGDADDIVVEAVDNTPAPTPWIFQPD